MSKIVSFFVCVFFLLSFFPLSCFPFASSSSVLTFFIFFPFFFFFFFFFFFSCSSFLKTSLKTFLKTSLKTERSAEKNNYHAATTTPTTYFEAVIQNPTIFEDKDWYGEEGAASSSSSSFAPLSVLEVDDYGDEAAAEERYGGESDVHAAHDYLYDFGQVVSPKTSRSSSPTNWVAEEEQDVEQDVEREEENQEEREEGKREEEEIEIWHVCVDQNTGETNVRNFSLLWTILFFILTDL